MREFQYPRNGYFLYELWKKILWPQILNPMNVIFVQSMKIGAQQNKAIHSISWGLNFCGFCGAYQQGMYILNQ